MQVQINYGDINGSEALSQHVNQVLDEALSRHAPRVTRVEVHLHDDKQKRRGPDDKRCVMEVRLAGEQPLAVEARAGDIYKAAADSAAKLGRAVAHKIDRQREP